MKKDAPKLIALAVAVAYTIFYTYTKQSWHFIDNVDLLIHEAGHVIFGFFPDLATAFMGSGFQILVPLIFAGYFFLRRDTFAMSIMLLWAAMNCINVSVYAGDAIAMELPLLGGEHDWNYILSTLDILKYTPKVALGFEFLGYLFFLSAIAVGFLGIRRRAAAY